MRGTASVALAAVMAQALTALGMLALARRLGPAAFGEFASLYSLSLALAAVVDFGGGTRMVRELATGQAKYELLPWAAARFLISLPVVGSFATWSAFLYASQLSPWATTLLSFQTAIALLALGLGAGVRALISPAAASWSIVAGNCVFAAVVVGYTGENTAVVAAFAASLSWVVTSAASFLLVRTRVWPPKPSGRQPWTGTWDFGLTALANNIYGSHYAVLTASAGAVAAGPVAAVGRWTAPVQLLGSSFSADAFPRFARAETDSEALAILRTFATVAAIGAGICGVGIAAAPFAVDTLLGEEYSESTLALRVQLIAATLALLSQPCMSLLQARGQERPVARLSMVVAVTTVPAVFVAGSTLGGIGLPIVNVVAQVAIFSGAARMIVALRNRGTTAG